MRTRLLFFCVSLSLLNGVRPTQLRRGKRRRMLAQGGPLGCGPLRIDVRHEGAQRIPSAFQGESLCLGVTPGTLHRGLYPLRRRRNSAAVYLNDKNLSPRITP